jgi:hypothetical protein
MEYFGLRAVGDVVAAHIVLLAPNPCFYIKVDSLFARIVFDALAVAFDILVGSIAFLPEAGDVPGGHAKLVSVRILGDYDFFGDNPQGALYELDFALEGADVFGIVHVDPV